MRMSIGVLNPKFSKRRGGDLRNRVKNPGEVAATQTVRSDSESPIVMSASKTTMATGVAIDDNNESIGEESSGITVKCGSGKEYRRLCREDILVSKTNVKANCYCNVLSGVEKLRRTLSKSEFKALGKTPFGHLRDVGNLKWVNGQLLILLALNYVEPMEPDSDAISFHIRDRVISFKKTDFALITGFKFGCPTEQEREYTGTSDISKRESTLSSRERVHCPQKSNGPSSGIFVIKMAELLMMGREVIEIEPGQVNTFRKKITADLLMYASCQGL